MLRPRAAVRNLPAYHPPLAGRSGLRLDFNENTAGCSPRVLEKLRSLGPEQLAKYPEREPVEAMVAGFLGISPKEILLTNGVDEAIHLLCQAYLGPGDQALIFLPTYSMYRIYILAAGAELISVPLGDGFQLLPADAIRRITARTRLIVIANPNNPTGTAIGPEALLEIAHAAPEAALLVDEAYFEFHGQTLLRGWAERPNLFVARTFSKAYGLAGLRIGLLAGDREPMQALRLVSSPYNVNAVALACLPEALGDQNYLRQYVKEVLATRSRLEAFLGACGIPFWASQANFVLARVGESAPEAARFVEAMRRRGILVRDRSADYACAGCVRMTCGPQEHADRLLGALNEVSKELSTGQGAARS
jgi:histidinol-phosphate aminotransferase